MFSFNLLSTTASAIKHTSKVLSYIPSYTVKVIKNPKQVTQNTTSDLLQYIQATIMDYASSIADKFIDRYHSLIYTISYMIFATVMLVLFLHVCSYKIIMLWIILFYLGYLIEIGKSILIGYVIALKYKLLYLIDKHMSKALTVVSNNYVSKVQEGSYDWVE